jgi:hypothetical protein
VPYDTLHVVRGELCNDTSSNCQVLALGLSAVVGDSKISTHKFIIALVGDLLGETTRKVIFIEAVSSCMVDPPIQRSCLLFACVFLETSIG